MGDNSVPPETFLKSPYLDVSVLPDEQYIYYNNQPKVRGRMEYSFAQIGTAVMVGGAVGGLRGFLQGREAARGHPPNLQRVILFNQIVKMSKLGNTLGLIALMYSGIGIAISELRGMDDHANTVLAATGTGCLYKCTSGFRKMINAGAFGLAVGAVVAVWNGRAELWLEWRSVVGTLERLKQAKINKAIELGLFKKKDDNDIECYHTKGPIPHCFENLASMVLSEVIEDTKQAPGDYFNFGFCYQDFKSFLLKLVYMRAERRFIERSLSERMPYDDNTFSARKQGGEEEDPYQGMI